MVSAGTSAPGMKTAAPTSAFLRENVSISCCRRPGAPPGSRARERCRLLSEPRRDRARDHVDGNACPGVDAHDVRGEHERDWRGAFRPAATTIERHAGAMRALEARSSSSVALSPIT